MHADPAAHVLCCNSHVQLRGDKNGPKRDAEIDYCLPAATLKTFQWLDQIKYLLKGTTAYFQVLQCMISDDHE